MTTKEPTPWPAYPYHLGLYYTADEMRDIERRAKHRHQDTRHEEQVAKRHVKQVPRNVTAAISVRKGKTG